MGLAAKVASQKIPTSLSDKPAFMVLWCPVIGWEQLVGSTALAETVMDFRAEQLELSVRDASCSQASIRAAHIHYCHTWVSIVIDRYRNKCIGRKTPKHAP